MVARQPGELVDRVGSSGGKLGEPEAAIQLRNGPAVTSTAGGNCSGPDTGRPSSVPSSASSAARSILTSSSVEFAECRVDTGLPGPYSTAVRGSASIS